MPEPVDRKDPEKASAERKEREMRDREELGRPPEKARERALAEDVTDRRDREAREEAERIEEEGKGS